MDEDAVERIEVITGKLLSQFSKKGGLLLAEASAVKVKPIRYTATATITATNGFDWIGAHELRDVMPDRFLADTKFSCQIVICIVPSEA